MRTLTSVFSILALTLAIGCGSDDDDGGGTVDAAVATVDAMVVVPDAMAVGTGAESLGQICGATMCPAGYTCAAFDKGATEGMCITPCTMSGMTDVCGAANGFPGPGVGICALADMAGNNSCGIACGAGNGGDMSCPAGLVCDARLGGELCLPPVPVAPPAP